MAEANTHANALTDAVRKKYAQDKQVPFLIHITDGRLVPNTLATRGDPHAAGGLATTRDANYVPYHGDPKASTNERLKWLRTANVGPRSRVMNSASDDEVAPVDIGKLTKDQLVSYALAEFGLRLKADADIRTMRKAIMAAAGAPVAADEALG